VFHEVLKMLARLLRIESTHPSGIEQSGRSSAELCFRMMGLEEGKRFESNRMLAEFTGGMHIIIV
jgi:hypothetical protein